MDIVTGDRFIHKTKQYSIEILYSLPNVVGYKCIKASGTYEFLLKAPDLAMSTYTLVQSFDRCPEQVIQYRLNTQVKELLDD